MDVTEKIIEMEYEMFDRVNEGKERASCQDDKAFFRAMRRCQFAGWNEAMKTSYRNDLEQAEAAGVNLVTEKYGYMMKWTAPDEYTKIKDMLQQVTGYKEILSEQIHNISMDWTRLLSQKYPLVTSEGRSVDDDEASRYGGTSISTYLRGELLTYSENTLREYLAWQHELLDRGENMNRLILEETVKHYGFASIEEAEEHCNCRQL